MKIIVLGAGLVGSAIVKDLAREDEYEVLAADYNQGALDKLNAESAVTTKEVDLSEKRGIASLVENYDLVISAVPGFLGFSTLQAIISAGKKVVDISFFNEDPFLLDDLAKENDVTAVVDCGVAPGLCNITAGHVTENLEKTESYSCYVGGLPEVRRWPYEYMAVFSPADMLEEYGKRQIHLQETVTRRPLNAD